MFNRRMFRTSVVVALLVVLMTTFGTASAETVLGGSVTFRDSNALSDSLVISLSGVPAPVAGTAYEGWLIGANGKVSTGVLTVTDAGAINSTYVSPTGANLVAAYYSFAISEEPVPDSDPDTPGTVLYSDTIPSGAFLHMGHLLSSWPANPSSKGLVVGLREQVDVARTHAVLADNSTTLASVQSHAHHVINIIEGSGGANYVAAFGDPGDGNGVLNYAADAIVHATLAKNAAPDDATVTANADGVIATANNVITWATTARDNALLATVQTSLDIVTTLSIDNAVSNLTSALEGRDGDGDGTVESIANEGGAWQAYTSAQDIGLFMPTMGATPGVGDSLVPVVALSILLAGLALGGTGGFILLRRWTVRA